MAKFDSETMIRLRGEVRGVWDLEPQHILKANQDRVLHSNYIDGWGGGTMKICLDEWFPGVHTLHNATTVAKVENYDGWPDMTDPSRVAHVAEVTRKLAAHKVYAILATPWLLFPFERA